MDLSCPSCDFSTVVPDAMLPPEGTRARCQSCQKISVYLRGGLVDDDPTPPQPMAAVAPPAGRAAPAASQASSGSWRFRTSAGDEGPYDLETVKSLVRTSSLHPDDQALAPGHSEWQRAGDHPALARYFRLRQATPAPAASGPAPCFKHPAKPGAWLCSSCGTLCCSSCVLEREMQRVKLKLCPRCEKAVQAFVPSKVVVPFWRELPQILAFPVKGLGWLAMILCAVAGVMAGIAGAVPGYGQIAYWILAASIYAYHLLIIREATSGKRNLPDLGGIGDIRRDLVGPGGKACLVTILLFLGPMFLLVRWAGPAALNVAAQQMVLDRALQQRESAARGDQPSEEESEDDHGSDSSSSDSSLSAAQSERDEATQALHDHMAEGSTSGWNPMRSARNVPKVDWDQEVRNARRALASAQSSARIRGFVTWAAFLAALSLWPLMLIIVALFNTIMPVFQPQILVRIIQEIQREYWLCVVFTLGLIAIAWIVSIPVLLATKGFFGPLANPVAYYFSFMAFHIMGRTAEMAEQKIDWH